MFKDIDYIEILNALKETVLMSLVTSIFVLALGLLLGYALYKSENRRMWLYKILNTISNIARSIPFIILLLLLMPFTHTLFNFLFGSDQRLLFNWPGAVPALIVSATPFYARLVHNSLKEIPEGTKEMLISIGASDKLQTKVILTEALPSLIAGFTQTVVTLIGFTTAAAVIGAGGLGDLAFRERNKIVVVLIATVLTLLIVFIVQFTGDMLYKKIDKR